MDKLGWVSLALIMAACGASGPSAQQACADLAQARCMKRQSCTNGFEVARAYGDLTTCLTREALQCTISINAPESGSTPSGVELCVAQYGNFSCSDFFANNPPAACISIGTKAMNAPCAVNAQCTTGYCDSNKTATCGTCGGPPTVGSSCQNSNCARGQSCVERTLTCEVLPGSGGSCDNTSLPCQVDLGCVGNTGGAMGTCMPGSMSGAACGGTNGPCDGTMGLSCQGLAGMRMCAAVAVVGDGQPCGTLPDGTSAACAAGDCYATTGLVPVGGMGTCKAAAGDGQPCDINLGPSCLAPARCVVTGGGTTGVCTIPSGATCG